MFALGSYILNVPEDGGHSELAMTIDHDISVHLLRLLTDGSPIVRQELACALHGLILLYEKQFQIAALRNTDGARAEFSHVSTSVTPTGWIHVSIEPGDADPAPESEASMNSPPVGTSSSHFNNPQHRQFSKSESPPADFAGRSCNNSDEHGLDSFPHKGCGLSLSTSPTSSLSSTSSKAFYTQVWKGMIFLASDPHLSVAHMAQHVVHSVHDKVMHGGGVRDGPIHTFQWHTWLSM